MKYENKSFSVGMPRVTQEQWDAIFAKRRPEPRTVERRKPEHVCGLTGHPIIDERAERQGAK